MTGPLLTGEKVHQRLVGYSNPPAFLADAPKLAIVLDAYGNAGACNTSLSIRQGQKQVAAIADAGDGLGTTLTAGDATGAVAAPSYLSLRTTDATGTSAIERIKIGPLGTVTLPESGRLDVLGYATASNLTVFGNFTACNSTIDFTNVQIQTTANYASNFYADTMVANSNFVARANASFCNALVVNGAATFNKPAVFFDSLTAAGVVSLCNDTTFYGQAGFRQDVGLTSNLTVAGAISAGASLTVLGTSTTAGIVDLASNLNVLGPAMLSNSLAVYGPAALGGDASVSSNLTVLGSTTLAGSAVVVGASTLEGPVTLSSNLTVLGAASFNDAVRIAGPLTTVGAATLSNGLVVYNKASLCNDLAIAGSVIIAGSVYASNELSCPAWGLQSMLSGGGTVTWSGSWLKWTGTVTIDPVNRALTDGLTGEIDVGCPLSGTITYYGSSAATTVTCTASGIPMATGDGSWYALYVVLAPGQSMTDPSLASARMALVRYSATALDVGNNPPVPTSNWIMIACTNLNDSTLKWLPSQTTIPTNGSYTSSTDACSWRSAGVANSASNLVSDPTVRVTGLTALGASTLSNGLVVYNGATSLCNSLGVSGAVTTSGALTALGASTLSNGLVVYNGATSLCNSLGVSGALTTSGALTALGASTLSNGLAVYRGSTSLCNNVGVSGTLTSAICCAGVNASTMRVAGQTVFQVAGAGVNNQMMFTVTDGTADAKNWAFGPNGNTFYGYIFNDAVNLSANWVTVTRSGNTVSLTNFPAYTTVGNGLTVNGGATSLCNNVGVSGALTALGASTLSNGLTVYGGATALSNALTVSGNVATTGTLYALGAASLCNSLGVAGAMTALGASTLSNGLAVYGGSTALSNALTVSGNVATAGTLYALGAASLCNSLGVAGAMTALGASTLSNGLSVYGGAATSLYVAGKSTLDSQVTLTSNLVAGANVTYPGCATAQLSLAAGDTITWTNGYLKWTGTVQLFLAGQVSAMTIICPTFGTINCYNNSPSISTIACTAAGIPITGATNSALYFVVSAGNYTGALTMVKHGASLGSGLINSDWILIASTTGFNGTLKWCPGNVTFPTGGGTYTAATDERSWQISSNANAYVNSLTAYGASTLSNGLTVFGGATALSNALTVSGTLTALGASTLSNGLTVYGGATALSNALTVSGNVATAGTLYALGAASLCNSLGVAGAMTALGASTLSNGLTVFGGATALSNALTVSGNVATSGTLYTLGATSHCNSVGVSGALTALGASTLSNGLTVFGGATALSNALTVAGNIASTGALYAFGAASLCNSLGVAGAMTTSGAMTAIGVATLCNNATVYGQAAFGSHVGVSSNLTVTGTVTTGASLTVLGTSTTAGIVDLASNLNVLGPAMLSNSLTVYGTAALGANTAISSNLTVLGSTTVSGTLHLVGESTMDGAMTAASTIAVLGVSSFSNSAYFSSNVACLGRATVGSNANATYPLYVQGVASDASGISIRADGDVSCASDARLKTDVRPIGGALAKVLSIGGYSFLRIGYGSSNSRRSLGVIAQEVRPIVPEVVGEGDDGVLHVAYGNITALLIEALKELRAKAQPASAVVRVATTTPDEPFEVRLPSGKWEAATVSCESAYSRCYAAIRESEDGIAKVVGRCEWPGDFVVVAHARW
jgi:cytoskeletal protein CcmA (bactofilin family)